MTSFRAWLLGMAGALTVTAAQAADPGPIMIAPVVTVMAPAPTIGPHDWSGPSVGVFGRYQFCGVCLSWGETGVQAGYDFQVGNAVFGAKARLFVGFDSSGIFGTYGEIGGRAGFAFGRVLAYESVGVLARFGGSGPFFTVRGGAELALGSNLSIFAEAGVVKSAVSPRLWSIGGGINWHFGH